MKNFQDKFTEYKRTKKSFMDVLANIVALVSSFYSIISYGFINFYSTTFDNYKIVEKILNNKIKINLPNNNKNNKEIELSNDFKGLDNLMSNQSMDNLIINDDNIEIMKIMIIIIIKKKIIIILIKYNFPWDIYKRC